MTGLGATIYLAFFAMAALWLYLTSDYGPYARQADDQGQAADFSNSDSAADEADVSSPWLASHSVLK